MPRLAAVAVAVLLVAQSVPREPAAVVVWGVAALATVVVAVLQRQGWQRSRVVLAVRQRTASALAAQAAQSGLLTLALAVPAVAGVAAPSGAMTLLVLVLHQQKAPVSSNLLRGLSRPAQARGSLPHHPSPPLLLTPVCAECPHAV